MISLHTAHYHHQNAPTKIATTTTTTRHRKPPQATITSYIETATITFTKLSLPLTMMAFPPFTS
jgi:hypothetical protein